MSHPWYRDLLCCVSVFSLLAFLASFQCVAFKLSIAFDDVQNASSKLWFSNGAGSGAQHYLGSHWETRLAQSCRESSDGFALNSTNSWHAIVQLAMAMHPHKQTTINAHCNDVWKCTEQQLCNCQKLQPQTCHYNISEIEKFNDNSNMSLQTRWRCNV